MGEIAIAHETEREGMGSSASLWYLSWEGEGIAIGTEYQNEIKIDVGL